MSKIPKIIHQIFFLGAAAIPEKYKRYQQTVLQNHSHWEYQFWNEEKARQFMAENFSWFLPTFDAYPHDIQRRDAIRYFILYHYGRFYFMWVLVQLCLTTAWLGVNLIKILPFWSVRDIFLSQVHLWNFMVKSLRVTLTQ
ncbi:glycosyltransferase [Cylindrospermopsis raciborskii]|uniref:glycosyltransferase family 32 protein n=1 Tax=Cylindrospermopsis raciborskii TaxID=77022 RepID=UPI0026EFF917|nr:glycosyltransferase [Cylindrospermopsis raciborskii]